MRTVLEQGTTLSSGSLAKRVGVSTDTLRFYERQGLLPLPPRDDNGYRRYPPAALDRVLLIRRSLALGISIDELGRILRVRDRGGAPCVNARALLADKLHSLDARLAELRALRRTLQATLEEWDQRLARNPAGTRARLLESIAKQSQSQKTRRSAHAS